MKTKTMYVADDGTPFNSMQECIAYEKSVNKYTVFYKDMYTNLISKEFGSEAEAKRYIANLLHDCFEDKLLARIKLVHCGTIVEFNSDELSKFVPAHYNIDGDKLNKVFQMSTTKNVKIEGYTLHGDYYLADKVIPNKTWKETIKMKEEVTLPNGKKVIAHTLSKEELETISFEERKCDNWYWTSTPIDYSGAWGVSIFGDFYDSYYVDYSDGNGGARLGFKNPFAN